MKSESDTKEKLLFSYTLNTLVDMYLGAHIHSMHYIQLYAKY